MLASHAASRLALLAAALSAAACVPPFDDRHSGGYPLLGEVEPNDTPWETTVFDPLAPGDLLWIEGHVGLLNDSEDHVGFEALAPMEVRLHLNGVGDDTDTDFDLAVWDEGLQTYVLVSDDWGSDSASFLVDWAGPFQVRVCAAWLGSGSWELEVEARPHPGFRTGSAPDPNFDAAILRTRADWLAEGDPPQQARNED
jgi:hypothetical protein